MVAGPNQSIEASGSNGLSYFSNDVAEGFELFAAHQNMALTRSSWLWSNTQQPEIVKAPRVDIWSCTHHSSSWISEVEVLVGVLVAPGTIVRQ